MNLVNPRNLFFSIIAGILLMILAVILTACGSTRKQTRATTSETRRDSTAVSAEETTVNWAEYINNYIRNLETETSVTIYDTTQPVDTATGRPPIAAEINRKAKLTEKKNETATTADSTHTVTNITQESDRNTQTDTQSTIEHEESKILENIKGILFAISGILLIRLIAYIVVRRKKTT